MVDSHSRVRDGHSLPQLSMPTTLPLVGLPRHGADGEGDDASGGRSTAFALALVTGVIVLGWAAVAAVLLVGG